MYFIGGASLGQDKGELEYIHFRSHCIERETNKRKEAKGGGRNGWCPSKLDDGDDNSGQL